MAWRCRAQRGKDWQGYYEYKLYIHFRKKSRPGRVRWCKVVHGGVGYGEARIKLFRSKVRWCDEIPARLGGAWPGMARRGSAMQGFIN